ncbi:FAD-dependent oxidoreductase [Denitrobacterium detoxificans]|uniref:FAD binding domain-containing protein n=1 Tax=Denitrobacterium detoxificans TaxID=79604 RepID=A0A1H8QNN4_9ACTN|nr:FAD-binding protein [Denitrobacterium detoxificans]SEO55820.1 FAD binding domain-containing protein [Denitrobacterium detoxificans]
MSNISRRDLFKLGGVAAASMAGASALAACSSPKGASEKAASSAATADGLPSFFASPDAITDIAETKDYEIVVIGAGAAGVPCALSAFEKGAKVALLQKEKTAISQGNTCDSIDIANSDPAGVQACISLTTQDCCHRTRREQAELWANNSYEALKWLWDIAQKAGAQTVDTTAKWTSAIKTIDGYNVNYFAFDFGPKPYNTGNGMRDVAKYAEDQGMEIFYETPAQQLVVENGKVTGVIAKADGKYVKFNASKGVVVATGDYENDDDMMAYYNPDMANLYRKEQNKTGDGQKMMVWAGARMESVNGSKVIHDFDAGPGSMADMPFLCVKNDGTRFCNEQRSSMAVMGNFLTSEEDAGWYTQVFDSDYMTACAEWPGKLVDPEGMKAYMPEESGEKKGVYENLINTYKADTIEELGNKLGLTDVKTFVKTVERYNELAAKGVDEDMGKAAKWLAPIATPPFYGIHRHVGVSTVIHGVNVNGDMQVLDKDGKVIEGLYAIGNCAGNFFGSPDYPMTVPGLSLGRAHTQGYVVGRALADK